jgi:hypothetical protein
VTLVKRVLLLIFCIFLVLNGCSEKEVTSKDSESKEKETEEKPEQKEAEEVVAEAEESEPEFENQFPLTGIGTDENVQNRAFAFMINNHPKARPQTGLDKADLVYEVLAEGFITRFLAVYQSEYPEFVGPIRSSRPYYIELSEGFDAVYIAYGGSTEALSILDDKEPNYINGIKFKNGKNSFEDDHLYERVSFRKMPHNVYMKKENMIKGAEKRGFDLSQDVEALPFLTDEEAEELYSDQSSAHKVKITYSTKYNSEVTFIFDQEEGKYVRLQGEDATVDYETNELLLFDNIFIVEAPHKVLDSAGRRAINFKGGGNGILLQKGTDQEVTWENKDGRILPFKEGQALAFVPGKTWIIVVPSNPGISTSVEIKKVE